MNTQRRKLKILMNGMLVGFLEKSSSGGLTFSYDQKWLNHPAARPISLSLPLSRKTYEGDIVYNFFDNMLPDNPQVRARIQAKFQAVTQQPFDLLAKIGRDCVGAIQVIDSELSEFKKEIRCERLDDKDIASLLLGYKNNPLGMVDTTEEFRISIAGAQEKSAFLYYKNVWNRPLGDTPTSHIFKLPIGYIQHQQLDLSDSCENEWLCSKIAEGFGLPIAQCEILHFENVKVLVVERFDRKYSDDKTWIIRLPQEDMCQALGFSPNLKYQSDGGPGISMIMGLLLGSKNATQDRDLFYKTQIFFWLLAAIDGHAKNFSLFIEPEGRYCLTPLYDIMSAYPLLNNGQLQKHKIKMAMALRGKNNHYHWSQMQRRYFLETAKFVEYSAGKAEIILDEMLTKVESIIEQVSKKLPSGFPCHISEPIFEGIIKASKSLVLEI